MPFWTRRRVKWLREGIKQYVPYLPYNPKPKPPPPYVPPPRDLTITAPVHGSTVNDDTPAITGTTTGTGPVTVTITQGAATVQTLGPVTPSGGSWVATATHLADGAYTVSAQQTISGESVSTSQNFTVNVVTPPPPPPQVAILVPGAGSTTADNTPTIAGTATGTTVVTVLVKQAGITVQTLSPTPSSGTWTTTATTLADGVYTVEAAQTVSGVTGNATPVVFTVDVGSPAVVVTSVAGGPPASSTTDTTPTIVGTAGVRVEDSTTVTVQVRQGASVIQTLTPTRSGANWTTTPTALAVGSYQIRATQASSFGTGTSSDFPFTVSATQAVPAPTIMGPTEGQTLTSNPVTVNGTGGVGQGDALQVTVRVYPPGSVVQYTQATATVVHGGPFDTGWSTTLPVSLPDGSWRMRVEQQGTAGLGVSAFRNFAMSVVVGTGLAMPRGPVDGFAQAADFYDSVGVVHLPNNFFDPNPAATSIDTAIARLQELGLRHVRMGLYSPANHTDWNYHWKTQQFLIREQTLRGSNQPIFADYGLGSENGASTVKRSYTNTDGTGFRVLDGPTGQITSQTNWTTEPDMPSGGGIKYVTGHFYTPGWGTVSSIQAPNEPDTRSHVAQGVGSIRELLQKEKAGKNARTNTVLGGLPYIDSNTGRITPGPAQAHQLPIVGFHLVDRANWPEYGDYTQPPNDNVDVGCLHVYFAGAEPRVNNVWSKTQTTSQIYASTGWNGFLATGTRTYPLPMMVTETGYLQRTGTNSGGTQHCPEEVAGEYLIRTLLHNYLFGNVRRTFIFSLCDNAEGAITGGGRYGIMDDSFNRRASFYAIKNLMSIVGFRQGTFSTPVTTVSSGFTPGADNVHSDTTSPDRLNEGWLQLDDDTYIKFLQRDRMLWNRGTQAYKTVTDPQTVTLPLPSGSWTCSIAEPAKNPILDPNDGQTYANPGNGTAFAAPGVSGNGFTQSGNNLSVRVAGLTRVVKIVKTTSDDAAGRRVVAELS